MKLVVGGKKPARPISVRAAVKNSTVYEVIPKWMNERQAGQPDFPCLCAAFLKLGRMSCGMAPKPTHSHFNFGARRAACGAEMLRFLPPQGEIPCAVSKCPFNSNLRARLRGLWLWAACCSAACVCRDDWNNMTPSRRRGTRHRSRRRAVRRPRVVVCCGEWRGHVVPWRQANTGRDFNDHMVEGCGFPCRIWGIKSFALRVKVGKTTSSDTFWGLNSWRSFGIFPCGII